MLGLYLGAFLGPFGGNVVNVLLPLLQQWYQADLQLVALSVSAYMVPFAAGQFVSGALADRYGQRPVVVAGFLGFGIASLAAALSPWIGIFLVARAAQGTANACTTPILMATLGDLVDSRRLGRALGWFAAANTAGLFLAPILAGVLAIWDWRLVYLLLAAISTWLAIHYRRWYRGSPVATATELPGALRAPFPLGKVGKCPKCRGPGPGRGLGLHLAMIRAFRFHSRVDNPPTPDQEERAAAQSARRLRTAVRSSAGAWTDLFSPQLVALCAAALLGYLSLNGTAFLVALYVMGRFELDTAQAGLVMSSLGLSNMFAARPAGWAADRLGRLPVSAAGALGATFVLVVLPHAPHPSLVALLLLAGGAATAALWAGLTTLAVQSVPSRRATASSVFNAWKFVGYALAPVLYAPLYRAISPVSAFTAAAGASLLILLPIAALARSGRFAASPHDGPPVVAHTS